jgi:hypothetical protein
VKPRLAPGFEATPGSSRRDARSGLSELRSCDWPARSVPAGFVPAGSSGSSRERARVAAERFNPCLTRPLTRPPRACKLEGSFTMCTGERRVGLVGRRPEASMPVLWVGRAGPARDDGPFGGASVASFSNPIRDVRMKPPTQPFILNVRNPGRTSVASEPRPGSCEWWQASHVGWLAVCFWPG